jgi:hypothetical protein
VVEFAERHPWPDPERFTLCTWFVTMSQAEAALESAGIMAKTKRRPKEIKARNKSRRRAC